MNAASRTAMDTVGPLRRCRSRARTPPRLQERAIDEAHASGERAAARAMFGQ